MIFMKLTLGSIYKKRKGWIFFSFNKRKPRKNAKVKEIFYTGNTASIITVGKLSFLIQNDVKAIPARL